MDLRHRISLGLIHIGLVPVQCYKMVKNIMHILQIHEARVK